MCNSFTMWQCFWRLKHKLLFIIVHKIPGRLEVWIQFCCCSLDMQFKNLYKKNQSLFFRFGLQTVFVLKLKGTASHQIFIISFILDNTSNHPKALNDLKNCKSYLLPNTTFIIQPMYQGIITSFKAYYIQITFSQVIEKTTWDETMTLIEFWKTFNIKNFTKYVREAWKLSSKLWYLPSKTLHSKNNVFQKQVFSINGSDISRKLILN